MYPGLRKLAKNEVCDFFENSFTRINGNWRKMIVAHGHFEFSVAHGHFKFSVAHGQLAKNEICDFFENSCTRVHGNWPKMKFAIFLKIHVPGSREIGQK